MIGNVTDIIQAHRIEQGCPVAVVQRAIHQSNIVLQEQLTPPIYMLLNDADPQSPQRAGGIINGIYTEGADALLGYLVFATLITEGSTVITGFGVVEKRDEFSQVVDAFEVAKNKEAHYYKGIRQLCEIMGWQYHQPATSRYTAQYYTK